MPAYLLDTNVLIDSLNDRRNRRDMLLMLLEAGHRLCCSTVTVLELFAGLHAGEERAAIAALSMLEVIDVDQEIAVRAGRMKYAWARKGKTLSLPDVTIAATALQHGLVLFTDNKRDFPMPELKLHETNER